MRLVAWNLGHQTLERPINPRFSEYVDKLSPDILTLNEYVHGSTRGHFIETLGAIGLTHVKCSVRIRSNNQVLIASRLPFESGDLVGPDTEDGGGSSNFLHITFPDSGLAVVGIRVPAYEKKSVLEDYWTKLLALIRSTQNREIVFLGDFNADPDMPKSFAGATLAALRSLGWQIPAPSGSWSFVSGSRIDHVVAGPGIGGLQAAYVAELDNAVLASRDTLNRVSDHAALMVDLDNEKSGGRVLG